jgi:hypothetical protein
MAPQGSALLAGLDGLEAGFAQMVDRLSMLEGRLEPVIPQMPEALREDRTSDPRAPASRALQQVHRLTDGLAETTISSPHDRSGTCLPDLRRDHAVLAADAGAPRRPLEPGPVRLLHDHPRLREAGHAQPSGRRGGRCLTA